MNYKVTFFKKVSSLAAHISKNAQRSVKFNPPRCRDMREHNANLHSYGQKCRFG